MNWKLIFGLSLFGLAMAVATVFVIPSNVEPVFWLVIFIVCAIVIAKYAPGKFFLHGLLVSLVNSVWVTAAHVLLFDPYIAHHAKEAAMMTRMPMPMAPRLMMMVTGPIVGVISGVVLGLFAFIASRVMKRGATAA